LPELQLEAAAARNLDAVLERLGQVGKQGRHVLRILQVLLFAVVPRASRVTERVALMDTDARLVRVEIRGIQESHIVARHHRRRCRGRQRHSLGEVKLVALAAGALDLEIEAAGEARAPELEAGSGRIASAAQQRPADVPFPRRGQRDQSAAGLRLEPVARDQHLAEPPTLEVSARQQAAEIPVAFLVAAQ
jgi:hypothetical protein